MVTRTQMTTTTKASLTLAAWAVLLVGFVLTHYA